MAMRDAPPTRDPLAGVELRQAARFAMTLVEEQAKVCQRLVRLVELGFPELGELFDDPTCRTAREVLRVAPTARAATPPADVDAGQRQRRARVTAGSGTAKAERLQAAAADSIAVPELDAEVAFEVGLLLDQYDLLERQIERRRPAGRGSPRRRDRPAAADHPGRRPVDRRDAHRRDRRHRPVRRLRPAARLRRRPPGRAQLGPEGREPRDRLAHEQGRQQPPPGGGLPDGRRGRPAQPGHRRPLRAQAGRRQDRR